MTKKKKLPIAYRRLFVRDELKLHLLNAIADFKSKDEPRLKVTKAEKAQVLADLTKDYVRQAVSGE